jgi:hypothetical protein
MSRGWIIRDKKKINFLVLIWIIYLTKKIDLILIFKILMTKKMIAIGG